MLRREPGGPTRGAKHRRWAGLSARNRKDRLTISVTYKGGPEGWWLVEARGRAACFPAVACLHDVMAEINRTWSYED